MSVEGDFLWIDLSLYDSGYLRLRKGKKEEQRSINFASYLSWDQSCVFLLIFHSGIWSGDCGLKDTCHSFVPGLMGESWMTLWTQQRILKKHL